MSCRTCVRPTLAFLGLLVCGSLNAETTIKIDGSTGVKALVQALAAGYQKQKASTEIILGDGLKPKARISALLNHQIDIAMASHGIDIQRITEQNLKVHRFAKMAVVMAVNASVSIDNISYQQLCDVYAGRLQNWRSLTDSDLAIQAFIRPLSEVDAEVLQQKIDCFGQAQLADSIVTINKSGPMARSIAKTLGAIGMTTMVRVAQSEGKMKAIAINGIAPDLDNLLSGDYQYSRDSFLITAAEPSPQVAEFLVFIRSEQGAEIIVQNNAVPAE